jgi:hypothetical protein
MSADWLSRRLRRGTTCQSAAPEISRSPSRADGRFTPSARISSVNGAPSWSAGWSADRSTGRSAGRYSAAW